MKNKRDDAVLDLSKGRAHPSPSTHQEIYELLISEIQSVIWEMGWEEARVTKILDKRIQSDTGVYTGEYLSDGRNNVLTVEITRLDETGKEIVEGMEFTCPVVPNRPEDNEETDA